MPDRPLLRAALAAALLAPLLAGVAPAQAKEIRLVGIGIRKCAEWLQWKEAQNGEARALALEWAQGFMSGHNIYARIGSESASSVVADSKVLVPLLDSYCQKKPDVALVNGIIEITQSLGGAKFIPAPKPPSVPAPRPPDGKGQRES